MKIKDIEMYTVAVPIRPLSEGGIAPYCGSQDKVGRTSAVSSLFKVITDNGLVGWGEMSPFISHKVTECLLKEYIMPKLIGRDPFCIRNIMQEFYPVYNPQMNTQSLMAGIEVACWDIMGKALDTPIYNLMGGRVREGIPVAYALGILEIEESCNKVKQIKDEGFKTLKTKGGKDVQFDIERTRAMRKAVGPNFEIRVDMNQGYDTMQALRYLKGVEECDLQYVEQPLKINNYDGMKSLRARTKTPIGINEDCYIPYNLLRAIKRECIDVAIIDYEPLGGLSELLKLGGIAEEANLPLAHHCGWDMGVKLAAILHAVSAIPAFTYSIDSTYHAHEKDVLKERFVIEDGKYYVPEGPGLGIEVDEDKVRELMVK